MGLLAAFTLTAAQTRVGGGRFVRGDQVTCGLDSAMDKELTRSALWSRRLIRVDQEATTNEATPDEDRAWAIYRKLREHLTEVLAMLEDAGPLPRKAFRAILDDHDEELEHVADRFGQLLCTTEELQSYRKRSNSADEVAAAIDQATELLNESADNLDTAAAELERFVSEREQATHDVLPEKQATSAPEGLAELGDRIPADPAAEVRRIARLDLDKHLELGSGRKTELVELAIKAGYDADAEWAESPSAGGMTSIDLRKRLAAFITSTESAE